MTNEFVDNENINLKNSFVFSVIFFFLFSEIQIINL